MGLFKKSSKEKENKNSSLNVEEHSFDAQNKIETSQTEDVLAQYEDKSEQPEEIISSELTEKQIQKQNEIESVKSKISKILKSSNIEIVDENFGDEYDLEESDSQKQSQQDYDTLKALFGDKDRNKKDELTLTIDDFDYTYVGKYIEEFDLMHLKNIKHIRLRNPYAKKIKKALIVSALVVVVGVAAVCGFMFTKKEPIVLSDVSLSQDVAYSQHYENDYFYFDGLKINLTYSDGTVVQKNLEYEHLVRAEGGSIERIDSKKSIQLLGGDVRMTFNYEGVNLTYNIEVKEKRLIGLDTRCADGVYSLKNGEYINGIDDLIILYEYENYGFSKNSKDEILENIAIKIDDVYCDEYRKGSGWKLNTNVNQDSLIVVIYETGDENSIIHIV